MGSETLSVYTYIVPNLLDSPTSKTRCLEYTSLENPSVCVSKPLVSKGFLHPRYMGGTLTESQPGFIKSHWLLNETVWATPCAFRSFVGYSAPAQDAAHCPKDQIYHCIGDVPPTLSSLPPCTYGFWLVLFLCPRGQVTCGGACRRDTHLSSPWQLLIPQGHLCRQLSPWRRIWCWVSDQVPARCVCHHPPWSVTQGDKGHRYTSVMVEPPRVHSRLGIQGFSSRARCFHQQEPLQMHKWILCTLQSWHWHGTVPRVGFMG